MVLETVHELDYYLVSGGSVQLMIDKSTGFFNATFYLQNHFGCESSLSKYRSENRVDEFDGWPCLREFFESKRTVEFCRVMQKSREFRSLFYVNAKNNRVCGHYMHPLLFMHFVGWCDRSSFLVVFYLLHAYYNRAMERKVLLISLFTFPRICDIRRIEEITPDTRLIRFYDNTFLVYDTKYKFFNATLYALIKRLSLSSFDSVIATLRTIDGTTSNDYDVLSALIGAKSSTDTFANGVYYHSVLFLLLTNISDIGCYVKCFQVLVTLFFGSNDFFSSVASTPFSAFASTFRNEKVNTRLFVRLREIQRIASVFSSPSSSSSSSSSTTVTSSMKLSSLQSPSFDGTPSESLVSSTSYAVATTTAENATTTTSTTTVIPSFSGSSGSCTITTISAASVASTSSFVTGVDAAGPSTFSNYVTTAAAKTMTTTSQHSVVSTSICSTLPPSSCCQISSTGCEESLRLKRDLEIAQRELNDSVSFFIFSIVHFVKCSFRFYFPFSSAVRSRTDAQLFADLSSCQSNAFNVRASWLWRVIRLPDYSIEAHVRRAQFFGSS